MNRNNNFARDYRLKKTLVLNLILKSGNLIFSFLLVPALLTFLGEFRYGIWVTIYAVINWLYLFDFGIGQGLKLKLTKAFSKQKINKAKRLISSSYFFVLLVTNILLVISILSYFSFNWSSFLNVEIQYHEEFNKALVILIILFLLVFFVKLIGVVYSSLQQPYIDNIIKTASQGIFLLCINTAIFLNLKPNILIISVFALAPLFLIYICFNIHFFLVKSPNLFPKIKNVKTATIKKITNPGIQFFIIQIGCIILYSTDNYIILNLISPEAVTNYTIYYKYYSLPFMFYSIYTASHWESFIDALANKDFLWIKGKVRKFNKLLILLACSYFVLYLLEEEIINFWVGTKNLTNIKTLSPFIIAYFLISSITNNYIYIINSYGKLRIQLIAYILISLINIPLSIYFVNHTSLSSEGVILASSICLSALMILMPLQYYKIVNNKSKGIWGK